MTVKLYWESPNWRDDRSLTSYPLYKKKWALKPIICSDGTKVWFKTYYSYYCVWGHREYDTSSNSHTDFIEHITEAEYLVRKLADNL